LISFLIPFRSEDKHRMHSFHWLCDLVVNDWPDSELFVAGNDGEPFNRSGSRNVAAQMCHGDILVFQDADSYVPVDQMEAAIGHLVDGSASFVYPYTHYYSLTELGTAQFMSNPGALPQQEDIEYLFPSEETPEPSVGGCVIMTREAFEKVRGYDTRFMGWGEEDRAMAMALETLAGNGLRIMGPLMHLWHPHPESKCFGSPYFLDNRVLCNRYREAHQNTPAMLALVSER
jgi:hypothetical protein